MNKPKLPTDEAEDDVGLTEDEAVSHNASHDLAEKLLLTVDRDFLEVDELDGHAALLALEIAAAVWRRELLEHGAPKEYFDELREVAEGCAASHEVNGAEEFDPTDGEVCEDCQAEINVVDRSDPKLEN